MSTILAFPQKTRFTVPSARLLFETIEWLQGVRQRLGAIENVEIEIAENLRSATLYLIDIDSESCLRIGIGDTSSLLIEEVRIDHRPYGRYDGGHFFETFERARAFLRGALQCYLPGFDIV